MTGEHGVTKLTGHLVAEAGEESSGFNSQSL